MERLLPHLSGLVIDAVERRDDVVVLSGRLHAATARCGRCRQVSGRVHGFYQRRLRDVAVAGTGVLLQLRIRRFRCDNTACPARTFAEQVVANPTSAGAPAAAHRGASPAQALDR